MFDIEQRYRDLIEQAADGIFLLDENGNFLVANSEICKMLGYTREELLRLNMLDTYPNELRDVGKARLEAVKSGEKLRFERSMKKKDGSFFPVEIIARSLADGTVQSIARDITERKQAEEALQDSEQRFRTLAEASFEGIALTERGVFVDLNDQLAHMLGYSRSELIGKPVMEVTAPESHGLVAEAIRSSLLEPSEYLALRKDGTVFPVELRAKTAQMAGRQMRVAAIQNITARKQTEKTLRESEAHYRALIESQLDLISRYLPDTTLTFVNDAYCQFYGKTRKELIGHSYLFMIAPEFRELVLKETENLVKDPKPIGGEYLNYKKDGEECWIQWVVQGIVDEDGRVVELQAVGRDITRLKQTEQILRQSEENYRDLYENAPNGYFTVNAEGLVGRCNRYLVEMLGYGSADEVVGTPVKDHYADTPHGKYKILQILQDVRAGGTVRDEELQMQKRDGAPVWISLTTNAERDEKGQFRWTRSMVVNITERKRAKSELALERSLLNALMENIPDKIYFKDIESRFIRGSRAHAKLFGLRDASEMIGKTDMDFFSQEHARQAYRDEQRIIRTGEPLLDVEEKETWPDRPDTWVLTTKMPLRDQGGNIIGTFGISHDITERKRSEEALRESKEKYRISENKYRNLFEVAPEAIWVVENGKVIFWNAHFLEMFGYSQDEMQGMPMQSLFHHEDVEKAMPIYASRVEGRMVPKSILRYVTKQQKVLWVETIGQRIEWEGKIAVLYFSSDVTERKVLEEQFAQAQKMQAIGQLTGGVAHDFNNILQVINGYSEFLKERLSEENQTLVAELTKAAHRASALTTQLLAFSRKQLLRPRVVNAKALIRSVQMMLERVIGEDIELRTFIDPNTGNFLADPGQMEQVLLNLAVNARDAMPSGGKLTIETSNRTFDEAYVRDHLGAKAGQYVRIAVSDTGAGMDQETLSHLYEPFFTTKEKGKGTGLGLSTVYGIVKQSEGYISCYSEMGKGTTFTIYLPLTLEKADKSLPSAFGAPAPRGTETILLVDDDSAVRNIARIMLEKAGYVVIEASGGEEALLSARSISVALLVTDVVLPRMSGKEFAGKLQELVPGVRVLYVSGYTANVISHHGILEAGLDFLQKPFSSTELLTKVREILDRP